MDLGLKNKTAVITGSDSGIGFATAKILAQEGVRILMTDKTDQKLKDAAGEIQELDSEQSHINSFQADLRNNKEVLSLAEQAKSLFGQTDILVHCARIRGAAGDFLGLSDEDWLESIDVDLMSAVRVCRAFLPQMLAKNWGRIVMIASENALVPYEEESPYNASKAAVINLTKCLSKAYSPKGVLINCVSPAFIATPMTDAMMEKNASEKDISKREEIEQFLKTDRPNIVVDRRGKPEEVAAVIAFLCSQSASYVTGSNYRVDGGSVGSAFG